jgi:hypothetical protein
MSGKRKLSTLFTGATVVNNSCAALVLAAFLAPSSVAAGPSAQTFPAASVKDIVVETSGGPIELTAFDGGEIATAVAPAAKPGDECRVERVLSGKTLRLTLRGAPDTGFFSSLFGGSSKPCSAGFQVAAPARVAITARSGSGKIGVGAFAGRIDARTGSGAVQLSGSSGDLTSRSGSGTISGDVGGQKNVDIETGSGEISLRGLTGPISARTGSGSVSLDWKTAPSAGEIDVRTGSGSVEVELPNGAKLDISAKSGSGNIRSEFGADTGAAVKATLRTGSGDVTIKKKS